MATVRYVVEDYVASGYYQVLVQPDAATLSVTSTVSCNAEEFLAATKYVEDGYVEAGYFQVIEFLDPLTLTATFSISADLTEVTETEASATLSSSFSISENSGLLLTTNATVSSQSTVSSTVVKTVDAQADFGALFTPSVTTGVIKVFSATLSSSISMSATVSKFSGNEATLSNIVNLSLQGVKTSVFASTLSTSFTQSASANKTTNTPTTLSSSFTITSTPGNFQRASAHLTQNFILFTSKWPNRGRPISWSKWYYDTSGPSTSAYTGSNIVFSSSDKQYGTHSLQLKDDSLRVLSSELDIGYITNNVNQYVINHNQNFVFEFWVKMENDNNGTTNNIVASLGNQSSSVNLGTDYDSPGTFLGLIIGAKADKITAKFRDIENSTYRELTGSTSSNNFSSDWHHIVLRRYSGNTVELRVDNTQIDTYTYTGRIGGSTFGANTYNRVALYNWDQVPSNGDVFFDGLHFQLDSSTITGYSSNPAGSGTENTLVLANFDNNFDDDLGLTLEASATLEASGGVLSAIGGVFGVTANLTATTSLSADIDIIRTATATITSTASTTATILRIKDSGVIDCDTASTVSTTAVKQATASSSANLAFTSQIDGNAVRGAVGDFDSIATQLTAAAKIGDFLIDADVTASLTATPQFTASGQATITGVVSTTVNETLFKSFSATLSSSTTMTTVNNVILDPTAALSSSFSSSVSGDRIRFGVSTLSSSSVLVVDTNTTKDHNANLSSSFTLPAMDFKRTRPFDATISSSTSISTDGIKTVNPSIDVITNTFTSDFDVNVRRSAIGDFDSIATQLTAAAKIGDFLIDADVVSALTVDAVKRTGNVIVTTTTATLTADYGLTKQGASTQSITLSVTAEGTSNITGEAELNCVATVSSDPIKVVSAEATLSGSGGFVVTAVATRNNEVIMSSTFTQSADGNRIRFGVASVTSTVSGSFTVGKQVDITSQINSSSSITIVAKVIDVDAIVYKVPAEITEHTIVAENREFTVGVENREYNIT